MQSPVAVLTVLRYLNRDQSKAIVLVTHDPKSDEFASPTLRHVKAAWVESDAMSETVA